MPDDMNRIEVQEEKTSPELPQRKKRKKGLFLFLLFLLILGGGSGLCVSGMWDVRPLLYSLTPRLPYVGESLSRLFNIPEVYALTVEERRRYELRQWQDDLSEREDKLNKISYSLEALSCDLGKKQAQLDLVKRQLKNQIPLEKDKKKLSKQDEEVFKRVIKTYREISARRAAKIIEKLTPDLAVRIMDSLPEEDCAKILGRMDAARAAWLTEQLTKSR